MTLRDAFGEALLDAGRADPGLFVVDGDNSLATRTSLFRDEFPDRFIQAGVAEANLVGVAAGLAHCGHSVVASTFAAFFVGRALEVIRDAVALDQLPVLIAGTHAGISVGRDGITHMALEDVGIMRMLPNMTVEVPSDESQVRDLLPQLLALRGPAYMRISRWGRGELPPGRTSVGEPRLLRRGDRCVIVASGLAVHSALEAADQLAAEGLNCGVIGIHTIKPLDGIALRGWLQHYSHVVVAEEGWSTGGLFGAMAEQLGQLGGMPCVPAGVGDVFPDGGAEDDLFEAYGLTAPAIADAVRRSLAL